MAYFAQIDENNYVLRVLSVSNNELMDDNGLENEEMGVKFLQNIFGTDTTWIQTSYNNSFRKNFASNDGFSYNYELDAFIPPNSHENWILDESDCQWKPPIPYPEDGKEYVWDYDNWILINT